MKKNIEFMGRKISVMAIMVVLLVFSTASAAVYQHYATLQGDVKINAPISISVDGEVIELGRTHTLLIDEMTSPCTIGKTFQFNNSYGSEIDVSVLWILYEADAPQPLDASTSYWVYDNETVTVPVGTSSFTANLDVPAYMIGNHIFRIDVNPVY